MEFTDPQIGSVSDPATRRALLALLERVSWAEEEIAHIEDYVWALNVVSGKLERLIPPEQSRSIADDIDAEIGLAPQSQRDSDSGKHLARLRDRLHAIARAAQPI